MHLPIEKRKAFRKRETKPRPPSSRKGVRITTNGSARNPLTRLAQQRVFLETLSVTGRMDHSCKAALICTSQPRKWGVRSELFAQKWTEAREFGEKALLAQYEDNLDATVLPTKKALNLEDFVKTQIMRMFRMKRLDPQYRENAQVQIVATGPVAISMSVRGEGSREEGEGDTPPDLVVESSQSVSKLISG